MFGSIVKAVQPLIDLAQAASYPIALLMFIAAGCVYMTGNEVQSKKMIKAVVIGYIIVQFAPSALIILHNATKGLGAIQ